MEKIITFAHNLLKKYVTSDDVCLDLTLGNGHDCLFLTSICKHVYAFDIQEISLEKSKKLLAATKYENYTLINDSHINVKKYFQGPIKGAIYNLGYLPQANKQIVTLKETTLISLTEVLSLLSDNGIICIVIYPGHEEGKKESAALLEFTSKLDQKRYDVVKYGFINQINNPPYLIAIQKLKEK